MLVKILEILLGIVVVWFGIGLVDLVRRLLYRPNMSKIQYFKDKDGKIVIYHGVNVCNYSKRSPDLMPWHTHEDYDKLKKWGINLVRFVVAWEGIEPRKREYDYTYLAKMCSHIKYLGSIGIDVIIDLHQDAYARKYAGNGFPAWACMDEGASFKEQRPWYMNYLQPATIMAFRNFWKSDDLQYRYMLMLRTVYRQIKDMDNVIGIDIINEPFPNLPWIRRFERKYLTEFYGKAAAALLAEGCKKTLFFEPWMYTSTGMPTYLRFKYATVKKSYMPHYYAPLAERHGVYKDIDTALLKWALRIKAKEAQVFGTPLLFGEWGISDTCMRYLDYMRDFIGLCESYGASWVWWAYDMERDSDHGLLDNNKAGKSYFKELCHVYPQRIAGSSPKYSHTDKMFCLEYDNTDIPGYTVIFIPEGLTYIVESSQTCEPYGNTLIVRNNQEKVTKVALHYNK